MIAVCAKGFITEVLVCCPANRSWDAAEYAVYCHIIVERYRDFKPVRFFIAILKLQIRFSFIVVVRALMWHVQSLFYLLKM